MTNLKKQCDNVGIKAASLKKLRDERLAAESHAEQAQSRAADLQQQIKDEKIYNAKETDRFVALFLESSVGL